MNDRPRLECLLEMQEQVEANMENSGSRISVFVYQRHNGAVPPLKLLASLAQQRALLHSFMVTYSLCTSCAESSAMHRHLSSGMVCHSSKGAAATQQRYVCVRLYLSGESLDISSLRVRRPAVPEEPQNL